MKKLLFILLFASGSVCAQEKNDVVLDYVYENVGKKIGYGICHELIFGAQARLDSLGYKIDSLSVIPSDSVRPGDVIMLDGTTFSDGQSFANHIGIVYRILTNGKISIANQNVATVADNTKKIMYNGEERIVEEDSHVVISIIHPPSLVSGTVTYLRF